MFDSMKIYLKNIFGINNYWKEFSKKLKIFWNSGHPWFFKLLKFICLGADPKPNNSSYSSIDGANGNLWSGGEYDL